MSKSSIYIISKIHINIKKDKHADNHQITISTTIETSKDTGDIMYIGTVY